MPLTPSPYSQPGSPTAGQDPRAELERLRKLKRLKELEAKASGAQQPPAPVAPQAGQQAPVGTALNPQQEQQYRSWLDSIGMTKAKGFNMDDNYTGLDYDLRGYFQKYGPKQLRAGVDHFPDEFKLPSHETFSNESRYAVGADAALAGHWEGNRFVPAAAGTLEPLGNASGDWTPEALASIRKQAQAAPAPQLAGSPLKKEAQSLYNYNRSTSPAPAPVPTMTVDQRQALDAENEAMRVAGMPEWGKGDEEWMGYYADAIKQAKEINAADPQKWAYAMANERQRQNAIRDDVSKGVRNLPAHLERGVVGAAESAYNLPGDVANSMGEASANMNVTSDMAMRNANRMPQLMSRVDKGPQTFNPIERTGFDAVKMQVAPDEQSITGGLLEGLAQFIVARNLIGKVAPGGGTAAQLGKDALTTGVAYEGNTGRMADIIDPNAIPEGPLRNAFLMLRSQPEDSPLVGRFKNIIEDLTFAGPMVAPQAAVRGVQAAAKALNPPLPPVHAGGARPGPISTAALGAAPAPRPPVAPAAAQAGPPPAQSSVAPVAQPPVPQAAGRGGAGGPPPTPPATPAPIGPAAPATAVSSLGEAEVWFNSLPEKSRDAVRRTLASSGVTSRAEQDAIIADLNSIPPGRNSQNAFLVSQQWGDKYPSLRENLANIGGHFAVTNPAKPDKKILGVFGKGQADTAQAIMDTQGRKQVNSERAFLERSAETNFGAPSSQVAQELKQELSGLSKTYNSLLDPTKKRKFGTAKQVQLAQAEGELKDYLRQAWVIDSMPAEVRNRLMVDASDELRQLGWTADELKQMAGPTRKILAPLFEAAGPLPWSPEMWTAIVDQYPKFAAHVLQSSYAKTARALESGLNIGDNAGTVGQLRRMRGIDKDGNVIAGGLLDRLQKTMPNSSFSFTGKGSYADTRVNWGDVKGAQEVLRELENFKTAAAKGENVAEIIEKMDGWSPRQKEAALSQITAFVHDSMGAKVRNVAPDQVGKGAATAPNLTQLGNENFLKALRKVFGQEGENLATDIELSRAATTYVTDINPRVNSRTAISTERVKNAPNVFENPAGLEGNIIDKGAQYMAGGALLGSAVNPSAAPLLALVPAVKVLWNAYKKGKRLSNVERNQLADFWFRSREAGQNPEALLSAPGRAGPSGPPRPNLPSPASYVGNVATGAAVGAGAGAMSSGGDPGKTAQGLLVGAALGAGRAKQRSMRANKSLIKPRPMGGGNGGPPTPRGPIVSNGFGSDSGFASPTALATLGGGAAGYMNPVDANGDGVINDADRLPTAAGAAFGTWSSVAMARSAFGHARGNKAKPPRAMGPPKARPAPERPAPMPERPWTPADNRAALRRLGELDEELKNAPPQQWAEIEAEMADLRKVLGIKSSYNAPPAVVDNPRMGAMSKDDPFGDRAWQAQKKGLPPPAEQKPAAPAIDTTDWTTEDFRGAQRELREVLAYRRTAPKSEWQSLDEEIAALREALDIEAPTAPKPPATMGFGGNRSAASLQRMESAARNVAEGRKVEWVYRSGDDKVNIYVDGNSWGAYGGDDLMKVVGGERARKIRDSLGRGAKNGEFYPNSSGDMMSDYRGQHEAPDAESGAPIHDVTSNGIYPKDFYSADGLRFYGTGEDALDFAAYRKIESLRGQPDAIVKVWRAIPWDGPKPPASLGKDYLNPGDWVTISRKYALDHGEGALNGKFALVAANVRAKDIYTSGDSFLEWGWSPSSKSPAPALKSGGGSIPPTTSVPPIRRPPESNGFGGKPKGPSAPKNAKGPPGTTLGPPKKAEEIALRAALSKAKANETKVRRDTVMRDNRDELRRPAEEAVMQAQRNLNNYMERQYQQAANAARWQDRGSVAIGAAKKAGKATKNFLMEQTSKNEYELAKTVGVAGGAAIGAGALYVAAGGGQGKKQPKAEKYAPTDPEYTSWKMTQDKAQASAVQYALAKLGLLSTDDADGTWGTHSRDALAAWLSRQPNRSEKLPAQDYDFKAILAEADGGRQEGSKWLYADGTEIVWPPKRSDTYVPYRPLTEAETRYKRYYDKKAANGEPNRR